MPKDRAKRPAGAGSGEAASDDPIDRRSAPRLPVHIRIDYQTVDAFFSEFASNINQSGLYIKTNKPLPPGTRLDIQFLLPNNSRPVQVEGEVVWVNEKTTKGINPGMGIRFEELEPEAKRQINDLVRALKVSE